MSLTIAELEIKEQTGEEIRLTDILLTAQDCAEEGTSIGVVLRKIAENHFGEFSGAEKTQLCSIAEHGMVDQYRRGFKQDAMDWFELFLLVHG